jgi:RNA polymerase sigma-B factor
MPDAPAAARSDEDGSRERFRQFRRTRDRSLRNALVEEHAWLARVAARRFANRGEPSEDLLQVALLGVLKAVERFDPEYGSSFATFALPTVTGELRRHFRDTTWAVRVNRRAKELHLELNATAERLTHVLGRPPRTAELAAALGVSEDDVLDAIEAGNAYRTSPLSGWPSDEGVSEDATSIIAQDDRRLAGAADRVALHEVLALLPPREQRILYLRYYADLTQSEIAERVGVSQVHVSRLLRSCLSDLRTRLEGVEVQAPAPALHAASG